MTDIVIVLVVLVIVGAASWYVYKEKKNGAKCIGCPSGGKCSSSGGCSCGCGEK
ncbi:MAG: FeoB-associated Cys-rich membrane protein [Oscillibacter sp.]|nr:FeoB-associated Cys-rich membrane protein [Oscillibacter sp.]